ncbi:hypothetical protein D3C78_1881840 [compost metagenome]
MAINGVVAEYVWVHLVWRSTEDGIEEESIFPSPWHAREFAVFTQIGEGHAFLCDGGVTGVPGIIVG